MAKTVQYWGTVNYQELPLTGRLVTWTPKQKQEVPDAIATLLLAAGVGFLLDNDNNGELAVYATDSSGSVTGLVGPGGDIVMPRLSDLQRNGLSWWRQGCSAGASTIAAGSTLGTQIPFDKKFYGVRLTLTNYSATPYTVDGLKVASAPINRDTGATLTWSSLATFSGSTSVTVPAMTQGAGGVAANNVIPGVAVSDLIPVTAVDRTDIVGAPYLLVIRAYSSATGLKVQSGPITTAGAEQWLANRGYVYASQSWVGDFVTTLSAQSYFSSTGLSCVGHVEFYTGGNAPSFATFGDSLVAGYSGNAAGYQSGWANMLDYDWKARTNFGGVANYGVGGMLQANFIETMKAVCAVNPPALVYFPSGSPNTGSLTVAGYDAQLAATLQAIWWCKQRGITPVTSTYMPLDAQTTTTSGYRRAFNTQLKTALAGVCTVWDFAAVMEDPSNTGKFLPAYYYDGIHPNDAGHAALNEYVKANWPAV